MVGAVGVGAYTLYDTRQVAATAIELFEKQGIEVTPAPTAFSTGSPSLLEDLLPGGLVTSRFGRLPKRGESIAIDGYGFQILRADSRKIHALLVEKPKETQ